MLGTMIEVVDRVGSRARVVSIMPEIIALAYILTQVRTVAARNEDEHWGSNCSAEGASGRLILHTL